MFVAVVIILLSVVSLISGGNDRHIVWDTLCLLGGFFGLYGAYKMHPDYLLYYEFFLTCLFIFGSINLTFGFIYNRRIHRMIWDTIVTVFVFLNVGFTHYLRTGESYDLIEDVL